MSVTGGAAVDLPLQSLLAEKSIPQILIGCELPGSELPAVIFAPGRLPKEYCIIYAVSITVTSG